MYQKLKKVVLMSGDESIQNRDFYCKGCRNGLFLGNKIRIIAKTQNLMFEIWRFSACGGQDKRADFK